MLNWSSTKGAQKIESNFLKIQDKGDVFKLKEAGKYWATLMTVKEIFFKCTIKSYKIGVFCASAISQRSLSKQRNHKWLLVGSAIGMGKGTVETIAFKYKLLYNVRFLNISLLLW